MDCTNDAYTVQPEFIQACKMANTPATKRQASRFRMGKGRAYKVHRIMARVPKVIAPWFEPDMGSDARPPELDPKVEHAPETILARSVEIAEWKTRYHNRAAEQWPKAWALKSLGL